MQELTERLEQELKGVSFVPLDEGPDLEDLSPLGEAEFRVVVQHRLHLPAQSIPFRLLDAAEVHREAKLVVLHHGPRDGLHLRRQLLIHLQINRSGPHLSANRLHSSSSSGLDGEKKSTPRLVLVD